MLSYEAHGLRFDSPFSIDRIVPLSDSGPPNEADAILGVCEQRGRPSTDEETHIGSYGEEIRVQSRLGDVHVGRQEIKLFPVQGITCEALFSYYAVYILAFLLHYRDYLTVHASAVEIDGGTIAFVGPKGMGKSTTASFFYAQGHRLVSDDLIACRPSSTDAPPHVDPGFPWMKLGEKSLDEVLGRNGDKLERTVPDSSKRIVPTHKRQPDASLPLQRIYVLGYHDDSHDGQEVEVRRAAVKEACLVLLSNAFVQMFLEEAGADPKHLDRCATLCERVPVSLLVRPRSMDALPSIYDAVLDDLNTTRPLDSSGGRSQ